MYWLEDISILLYFGLATLYFGEFDVLFQYLFVHDPTNFREEPEKMNNKSEGRGTFVILNVDNSHTSVRELRNLLKIERGKAKDCNVMKAYTWIL